jgi:hypothetical protein
MPEIPPLLAKLITAQQGTGLPPAYVPKDERTASSPARTPDDVAAEAVEGGEAP